MGWGKIETKEILNFVESFIQESVFDIWSEVGWNMNHFKLCIMKRQYIL